ncbi:hypothetical protein KFL_004060040 [Klebsormidium nitens]|uniref:Nuclease associated modular domain-containing protein n=1 Tax=Klebsormidium nitens TaxID=105231 RepID=A0A1Y1IB75_KLENI|nr:hypothetical protein KFL_004060040 [Klebsormidium nitens]|eukprot:GAQ88170.1 hypothetical protein KFL_004060040 [Klebsormidium nitens]
MSHSSFRPLRLGYETLALDGTIGQRAKGNRFGGPLRATALNTLETESQTWLTAEEEELQPAMSMAPGEAIQFNGHLDEESTSEENDNSDSKPVRARFKERSVRYVENVPESALQRVRLKAEIHGEVIDEGEVLRRARIALANEGKRAWNKGKHHSEETKQRIRERTMAAMKDPKTLQRLERKHAEGWVSRRHIRQPRTPGLFKEQIERRKTQRLVSHYVLAMWRDANAVAARESKNWWKAYRVRARKPRAKMVTERRPRSAEHRQRISDAIRARWQEKKLKRTETLGNMKALEARRRELAEEARALFREAEAAAAALHAMPKSPAVLAALAETQRVLQEAAKKVEQATVSRVQTRIAFDALGKPTVVAREEEPVVSEPSVGSTGLGADPDVVEKSETEGVSHVALNEGAHVAAGTDGQLAKPQVNGHKVPIAEAMSEKYEPVRLDLRVRDAARPNVTRAEPERNLSAAEPERNPSGALREKGPPPGPFFRKDLPDSNSGPQKAD